MYLSCALLLYSDSQGLLQAAAGTGFIGFSAFQSPSPASTSTSTPAASGGGGIDGKSSARAAGKGLGSKAFKAASGGGHGVTGSGQVGIIVLG